MPKIEVYRYNNIVIPVAESAKKVGYQCSKTQQLFATRSAFIKHLKARRRSIHTKIQAKRRTDTRNARYKEFQSCQNFNEIIHWIETNSDYFIDQLKYLYHIPDELVGLHQIEILEMSMRYSGCVSNSHSCPESGTRNWGGSETFKDGSPKPNGYPGFQGRIKYRCYLKELPENIKLPKYYESPYFRVFRGSKNIINTGFGGGDGNNNASFDIKVFLDDVPGFKATIAEELLISTTDAQASSCLNINYRKEKLNE